MSGFFGSKRSARPGRSWLSRRGGFLAVAGAGVMFVGTAVVALACTDTVATSVINASTSGPWSTSTGITGASAKDVATVSWTASDNSTYGAPTGTVTFTFYDGTCG